MDNTVLASNKESVNLLGLHNTEDFIQTINHNVCLHDAIAHLHSKAEKRELEIAETLSLNSSVASYNKPLLNGTLHGPFLSELTNQDFFLNFDVNGSDEIYLSSLALEEDPVQAYLFKEADSTSGLYLNLNYSNSSFIFTCDSDAESLTSDDFGALGFPLENSNYGCKNYQSSYSLSAELLVDVFHHDHTYCQITHQLSYMSEHYLTQLEKSTKATNRTVNISKKQSCDEFLVKALNVPFSVSEIVTLPIDLFNSMLSKHYLTDSQLSLIGDIRKRGKNKIAAQNCRKRKLDTIINLKDDLCHLQAQKEKLKEEKAQCNRSISNLKQNLDDLCLDIFGRLRDVQERRVNKSLHSSVTAMAVSG